MEETQGMSQGQDTPAPVTSASTQSAPAPQSSEERTFRQSEVSDIVRKAKSEAVDSYKRVSQEQPQYHAEKFGSQQPQLQQQNLSNNPDERMRQLAAEEAQKHIEKIRQESRQASENENAQRVVQNFWSKIASGKEKYNDFETVTNDIDYARFPNVVQLLADYVDNSGDILYDLGKDRSKMATLENLAQLSARDAIVQIRRISQSIKDNEAASKTKLPNEPLSQVRPTNAGTDSGAMSVSDYRKKYRG